MAAGFKTGGRQKGTPNKATAEVRELASEYGPAAIVELARLSTEAQSETARISACNAIIERAYGKAVPGRTVNIELPETDTAEGVARGISAVLRAAAAGRITPGEASDFCSLLEAQRRAIELSDVEMRLAKLEALQGGRR
jgi:hypothetical protein